MVTSVSLPVPVLSREESDEGMPAGEEEGVLPRKRKGTVRRERIEREKEYGGAIER